MNSLKEYLEEERRKSCSQLVKIAKDIESALKVRDLKKLLLLTTEFRETDIDPKVVTGKINFLMGSNLFFMGADIDTDVITHGADPEFILCDAKDESKIILYSSEHSVPHSDGGKYAMSSLSIGADYGLLELRPEYSTSHKKLVSNSKSLVEAFEEHNDEAGIKIKEAEAVLFMHKIQRMREVMEGGKEIDYGGNRAKLGGVQAASIDDMDVAGAEYYGVSLTAYDTPGFAVGTDKILTAGGHLHFGGRCVKMLSMHQLKALVRKLDEKLLPIAEKVETGAAELRRQYYGFPGEFRLKPYGFEYRVLSCAPFWKKNLSVLAEILKEANRIITKFDF